MRVGGFLQGLMVLLIGCVQLNISFFSLKTVVIVLSLFGTATLFYGLFVIQATLSFWTIETLELMNITTYGGVETAQFPMSIYTRPLRLFFTFIIPLACVGYYPIATILAHEELPVWVGMLTPLAGFVFLYLACQLWKFGVRQYRSTGS